MNIISIEIDKVSDYLMFVNILFILILLFRTSNFTMLYACVRIWEREGAGRQRERAYVYISIRNNTHLQYNCDKYIEMFLVYEKVHFQFLRKKALIMGYSRQY